MHAQDLMSLCMWKTDLPSIVRLNESEGMLCFSSLLPPTTTWGMEKGDVLAPNQELAGGGGSNLFSVFPTSFQACRARLANSPYLLSCPSMAENVAVGGKRDRPISPALW